MLNKFLFVILSLFIVLSAYSQKAIITGFVKSNSGEPVIYAYIIDSLSNTGTITNNAGYFSLPVKANTKLILKTSHVSYVPMIKAITAVQDTFVTFVLQSRNLDEVVIKGTPLARQAMTGANYLDHKTIMSIPTFYGEHDIVRALTILPGISGGIEDYTAFYVRGGNRDQNLFLVDGARLFSTSHFGGTISMFNPDLIRHIDIYKGGAPARYGDGLSSVTDITLREGGENGTNARFDLGNMRSGLLLEGNIGSKINYLIAGRLGYWSLFLHRLSYPQAIRNDTLKGEFQNFNFYDLDTKLTFHPTSKSSLFFNIHFGKDYNNYLERRNFSDTGADTYQFNLANDHWSNNIINNNYTLGLKSIIAPGLALKNTLWLTQYHTNRTETRTAFNSSQKLELYRSSSQSSISDLSNKIELVFGKINRHQIITGGQVSYYNISSGLFQEKDLESDSIWGDPNHTAIESSIFIENDFQVFHGFFVNTGIRLMNINVTDTSFIRFEPRINVRYSVNKNLSFKTGFTITNQSFHSLVEVNGFEETEFWMLSNSEIHPQHASQISTGIYGKFRKTKIEYSAEAYYKKMSDLLYLPSQVGMSKLMKSIQKNGIGKSYGFEFLVQKKEGRINWAVAYTLAWSKRCFETLNEGMWFASDFDRRHDINISMNLFLSKKNTLNFNYLLQSGRPFTMPKAYVTASDFYYGYNGFWFYDGLNTVRAPWSKRFDLSYKRKGQILNNRAYDFTFSVMNVFGHRNPNSMYVKNNKVYINSSY
ncbi:MAG: TonB-dependent receptor plug domain-containing protein, partial [Prolixibacteraceae bacterium]|nr:TonB-dependent receptor plug domain-containing protein [Prolixibacteraceae bacterium]